MDYPYDSATYNRDYKYFCYKARVKRGGGR